MLLKWLSTLLNKSSNRELNAKLDALDRSQAIIEFNMDGTIITANQNFLDVLGYSLQEVQGKHHSIFVESTYAQSDEYKNFWQDLQNGEFQTAEYPRLTKQNEQIWIQATYNPIFKGGKPYKVVKFATDITKQKRKDADFLGQLQAISKSQAIIEFNMDGTIINANDNFLNALGYDLEEIRSQHHSLFVEPSVKESTEYKTFWHDLNLGKFQSAEFKRLGKGGREVWIQASYNPIFDLSGKAFKVVKYATDITERKLRDAYLHGQAKAISKSQAVIEFDMSGIILEANDNFLDTVGYELDEIQNQHHSIFVSDDEKNSSEYKHFWETLNRGEFQAAEYKRYGKNGKEIWIQASYNPIFDPSGKPFKVVKYATEITQDKLANANFNGQVEAINKSQAIIEFNMDGTIITANDNFLNAMGYTLQAIEGKHHRIFVEADYASSQDYNEFWEELNQGLFQTGEYKRLGQGGKSVWIQASYIKYATDITHRKIAIEKISHSLIELSKGNLNTLITDELGEDFDTVKNALNDN